MTLRRGLILAVGLLPLAAGTAFAQFPPAPGQQPQQPPCMADFIKLRNDTENKAKAIAEAGKRKVQPKEACRLFTVFHAAQAKMYKFATDNAAWCGIPPQVIEQIKAGMGQVAQVLWPPAGDVVRRPVGLQPGRKAQNPAGARHGNRNHPAR